jgi:hypothetical protein
LFDVAVDHFHHKHRFLRVTNDKIGAAIAESAHDS